MLLAKSRVIMISPAEAAIPASERSIDFRGLEETRAGDRQDVAEDTDREHVRELEPSHNAFSMVGLLRINLQLFWFNRRAYLDISFNFWPPVKQNVSACTQR